MASGPELFVVCKKCNSEVSPYITECPYCGTRLRKRAPNAPERVQEGLAHATAACAAARAWVAARGAAHPNIQSLLDAPWDAASPRQGPAESRRAADAAPGAPPRDAGARP